MLARSVRRARRWGSATALLLVAILAMLIGSAVLSGGARAASAVAAAPGSPDDSFYTPPSPLPAGRPGDVIRYRPVTATASIKPPTGTTIYQVLYLSTDALGRPDAVSGTIYLPKSTTTPLSRTPIVGFAPGTIGLADNCAPSRLLTSRDGINYNLLAVSALLNQGWAVAETDYQGMGTPGDHTYVVGRSEGPAVIDSVRAATRLPRTGLSRTAPVAFYGYSQGGGAAAWAGELAPRYAPELPLKGLAAGGVPADLTKVAALLDGGLGSGLEGAAAIGLNAAYPDLDLDSYLTAAGRTAFADIRTRCVEGLIVKYPFKKISDYATTNPLDSPAWQARLSENKLGGSPPKAPIYLYHSTSDELVPLGQALTLRDTYCAAGVNVVWKQLAGEHATGLLTGQAGAVSYLADRFAGKPAVSTCGSA